MSYKKKLLPIAKRDLTEIKEWYNEQREGLGLEFKELANKEIDYLLENPEHYVLQEEGFRRAIIPRFPYIIYYFFEKKKRLVIIFGVFHTSRSPEVAFKRRKENSSN